MSTPLYRSPPAQRRTFTIALPMLAALGALSSAFAAEHRRDVVEDWAFQHRYAVTPNRYRKGELTLRSHRQPAPLIDAQAGRLKGDRDPTDLVARRVDALLTHLAKSYPGKADWSGYRRRLDPLLAAAKAGAPDLTGQDAARQKTYIALCALRREIVFANPLLDFDAILFSVESNVGFPLTRATTGLGNGLKTAEPGGSLWVIRNWKGREPELIDLCRDVTVGNGPYKGQTLAGGMFHAPSLTFDGKTVLFSWAKLHYAEGEKRGKRKRGERRAADPLRIFAIDVDPSTALPSTGLRTGGTGGTNLRQITTDEGPWNDTEPCELPDGRICFMSTRREVYDRCMCCRPAFTLCSMKPDGTDIIELSFHETHEWLPSVSNDGMILYSRWDYVDRATWAAHGMWICFPDGRDPRAPNGNYYGPLLFKPDTPYARYNPDKRSRQRRQPMAMTHLKAIPGSSRLMAIGSAHHAAEVGPVLMLDLDKPDDYVGGQVTSLTPGRWGKDGRFSFSAPCPLSEDLFLVNLFDRIYLVDCFGNRELVHRIPWERNQLRLFNNAMYGRNCWQDQVRVAKKEGRSIPPEPALEDFAADRPERLMRVKGGAWRPTFPQPVRARPRPPVIPTQTFQSEDRRGGPGHKPATIVIQNVYDTDYPLPEGVEIKAMRIVQVLGHSSGDYTSVRHNDTSSPKINLGTVPVEADGSVHCLAPIEKGIYFQLLDGDGLAVHSMKTVTYAHPGERLSCRGCHEPYGSAAPTLVRPPLALQRDPSPVTPEGPGGKLLPLDGYVKPARERVLSAAARLPGGPTGRSLKGWVWQYRCNVIHAPPDVRTTPDAFGARKSRIWNFVREHEDKLKGLEPDDLRLFALWLDLLCVEYSWSGKKSVTDAEGVNWPLHPDLDVKNPLGLERVPQAANVRSARRSSETPNTKGNAR